MAEMTKQDCLGCDDDFYNGKNPMGIKECWMFTKAEVVTRYRTGTWDDPTAPGAFTEVEVPRCYHRKGSHYRDILPDFVKEEDVRKRVRSG